MRHRIPVYVLGTLIGVSASTIFTAKATPDQIRERNLARFAGQLPAPLSPQQLQALAQRNAARFGAQVQLNPAAAPRNNIPVPIVPHNQAQLPVAARVVQQPNLVTAQPHNQAPIAEDEKAILLQFAIFQTRSYNINQIRQIYGAQNDDQLYTTLKELYEIQRIADGPLQEPERQQQIQPVVQPGTTQRDLIVAKLVQWKPFYLPNHDNWNKKGHKEAAVLKNALFGCYADSRQKQIASVEQWHTNLSLFLRDPLMKIWVLPAYNGPSMAQEAEGWAHWMRQTTNQSWKTVWDTAKTIFEIRYQNIVENWFIKLTEARDTQVALTRGPLRARVKVIIDFLQATKNSGDQADKEFLKKAIGIIEDGQTACADRTVVSLDNLELATSLHRALKMTPASKVHTLLSVGLVQFRVALADYEFCRRGAEELEAALYYRISLNDIIRLGINTKASRYDRQDLDKLTLEQAIDLTLKSATPLRLAEFLASWEPWKEHMEPTHAVGRAKMQADYDNLYVNDEDAANNLATAFDTSVRTKNITAALDALKNPAYGGYVTQNKYYVIAQELIDD